MNRFLVSVLGFVNAAVALIIIFSFIAEGVVWGGLLWVLACLIAGIAVAGVVCGLFAIAISIEKSLRIIADSVVPGSVMNTPMVR